jgi:hypothetical protein
MRGGLLATSRGAGVLARAALTCVWTALLACALLWATERRADACLSNVNCAGLTPVCGANLQCRACASDLECGAPLSGDVCATSGTMQGACVPGGPISDAGVTTCSVDGDCGVGLVCDLGVDGESACVVGCHALPGGADTCPIGQRCDITTTTIGVCLSETAADAGTSTSACTSDTSCLQGLVCAAGTDGGALSCTVGCRDSAGNDTCPSGSTCNVADGGVGVCLGLTTSDAGDAGVTEPCSSDPACPAGLVCDLGLSGGAQCVVGCHAVGDGGADTCAISTHCSVTGGGLGICLPNATAGTTTANGSCNLDSECVEGLVCDHSLDGGAECVFGCHGNGAGTDTCPSGSHCSNVGGGVGVCLENGAVGIVYPEDSGSGGASSGGASSGGASSGGASSGGASSGGTSSGGASSGGASSGGASSGGASSGGASSGGASSGGASSGGASSGGASSGGASSGGASSGGASSGGASSGGASSGGASSGGASSGGASSGGASSGGASSGGDGGHGSDSGEASDATLAGDGSTGDGGNDGYLEGAGCSCSTAPGAGGVNGMLSGAMWAVVVAACLGRGRGRRPGARARDGKEPRSKNERRAR